MGILTNKTIMNENLNLVEILKDCPNGTKLYSPIYGDVELVDVLRNEEETYPIEIKISDYLTDKFSKDGRIFAEYNGECMLFPSKEQRDWSKFKQLVKPKFKVGDKIVNILGKRMGASGSYGIISEITDDKYIFTDTSYAFIRNQDGWELVPDKKPKFDPNTLNPFDKVLARNDREEWICTFFSHLVKDEETYPYACGYDMFTYCIPYNDDTKHLVGKTKEAPEFYRYWED